ncbi:hypothetical protein HZS_89 [Henneguya salminicola]|nr:hypothetical protein HZS_89 [Henneguya salminicola]
MFQISYLDKFFLCNREHLTNGTNIEVCKNCFKTEINILNMKIKAQFQYDHILIVDDYCVSIYTKDQIYNSLNHHEVLHEDMIKYEKMCMVLEKYLSGNRKKIQDIMTKILMKSLIYGFEDFCTYKLSSIILQYDMEALFMINEENREDMKIKVDVNNKLKSCYEKLYKYMEKYAIKVPIKKLKIYNDEDKEEDNEDPNTPTALSNSRNLVSETSDEIFKYHKRPNYGKTSFWSRFRSFFNKNQLKMDEIQFHDL